MKMRLLIQIPGMTLAVLLTLLIGSVRADDSKLEGTWDVTLKWPKATCDRTACNCPGGVPNIPITTLNTFLKGGGMVWSTNVLFVGPGQGQWQSLGHNDFMDHFKFWIFDLSTGFPIRYEDVTQDIHLTSRDTYKGTMTYDLFDAAGNILARECSVNIDSATRFE